MQTLHLKLLLLTLSSCTPAWAVSQPRSSPPFQNLSRTFDYVIVGGGTAGLTLANRLTENPSVSVAVIEAGTFPEDVVGNITQVPAYQPLFLTTEDSNPLVEWGFKTTSQAGKNGAIVPYYRGKTFGGCSSINKMAYSHSSKGAFKLWADTVGDPSYTYENVVPYYRKSMDFTPPDSATRWANATPLYNPDDTVTGGPLSVSYPSFASSWGTWVAKGMEAVGIYQTNAFMNGNLNGSSWMLETINHRNGFRASAQEAFLRPYLSRPNLVLFNGTLAERVIFDNCLVATGVEVTTCQTTYTLSATKEVIISAGAFQSPQLLMVSGVGPATLLQQHNITVVADRLGVGQGMNDHILFPLAYQVNLDTDLTVTAQDIYDFNTYAVGPLANPAGDFLGLEKIPLELRGNFSTETEQFLSKLPTDWPELAYLILPGVWTENTTAGINYATILPSLHAFQSRGNISIESSKMSDAPLINPNWFTEQADQDLMIAGFKRVRQMVTSKAMASVIIGDEFLPGLSVQTDAQILEYIRETLTAVSHAHSTCQMGKASDPLAVVDASCKVYGVQNLRIIDASVFPFLLPGPAPQTHVYMLAEKIADEIKKEQS